MNTPAIWSTLPMHLRPRIRYWLPGAAMDEEDLRTEIEQLYQRGFGGVEIVVLDTHIPEIDKGEDGWGTPNWDEMVCVIADQTQKLGMSMDIANGPGWPISSPAIESADDPAALVELTYGVLDIAPGTHFTGAYPSPRVIREEGVSKLIAAFAYQEKEKGILIKESFINFPVDSGMIDFCFPDSVYPWKLFAFYSQSAVQKTKSGTCYVIDHFSKEGVKACESYWDEVFSKYQFPSLESFFCDSLEYEVALDWTPEFPEEFENRMGYSILPYLPVIGFDRLYPLCDVPGFVFEDSTISDGINRDYAEVLTQLYNENHLAELEKMANKYGKTIRYQVAYNKPLEVERNALFVSVPENEALGRPAVDCMKTMAAAAHLGRKERYSFECAAEFGNSYGQDYEDLFWWVKRSLMAGMNAQVLHGASYSGKYCGQHSENEHFPGISWPGYEGFGKFVSNNWNRTPCVSHARGCMDAITRLNAVFRLQAKVDCAIFRDSFVNSGEESDFGLYPDDGALTRCGYNYEFISEVLLSLDACRVSNHILDECGVGYKALIIPNTETVTLSLIEKLTALLKEGLPIYWIGDCPKYCRSFSQSDSPEKKMKWETAMDRLWNNPKLQHIKDILDVPHTLMKDNILPEVILNVGIDVLTSVRIDTNKGTAETAAGNTGELSNARVKYFALYAMNRAIYDPEHPNPDEMAVSAIFRKGSIKGSYRRPGSKSKKEMPIALKGRGRVFALEPFSGTQTELSFVEGADGYMHGKVSIEEDELLLFMLCENISPKETLLEKAEELTCDSYVDLQLETLRLEPFLPHNKAETSFLRSEFRPSDMTISPDKLLPWKDLQPSLEHFSGKGIYHGFIDIPHIFRNRKLILELGEVCDTFKVFVDGEESLFPDQVMKRVDITPLIHEGRNELKIEVVSNLYNALFYEGIRFGPVQLQYLPRDYGVWETESKKIQCYWM